MPHTNRKKKSSTSTGTGGEKKTGPKLVHMKRQQIEDDDGWTHVIDTPRRPQVKVKEGQLLHAGDFERNGVSYVERTLEEMRADLEYYGKQWESDGACAGLKEKFNSKEEEKEGRVRVGDVVCLGLGSLQSARREGRRASFTQLAALRTIMELLGKFLPHLSRGTKANMICSRRTEAPMHIPRPPVYGPRQGIPHISRIHCGRRSISVRTYYGEELRVCHSLLRGCLQIGCGRPQSCYDDWD